MCLLFMGNIQEMEKMRTIIMSLDAFLMGIWGLTIIDLLYMINMNDFDFVDNSIKTLLAAAGLFYLVFVKIPNEVRNARLKRRIDKAEAKKIEMENETYIDEHKKNNRQSNS